MKRLILLVALAFAAATDVQTVPAYVRTYVVLPDVVLHEGVTADLSLTVFSSTRSPCPGPTVLAVHGMLHTAAAWEPLAATLFDSIPPAGQRPCRVLALDLPGHGRSGLPSGAAFGELTIDDYVSAVLGSLDRLHRLGIFPAALAGHSLGGALVVLAQQRLAAAGTNLRREHDVHHVVLLGAMVLNPIPSPEWDSGTMLGALVAYAQESSEMGRYLAVPVAFWRNPMFRNLASPPQYGAGTPSVDEIIARGYFGPPGSSVALESRGMLEGILSRPFVDAGLFNGASGTMLQMVLYEQDRTVHVGRSLEFYAHLTGYSEPARVVVVSGPDAVHDTHISNPALLLAALWPWQPEF